jgi:outer membrane protein OmpA-like peptidoglycan-associated protein
VSICLYTDRLSRKRADEIRKRLFSEKISAPRFQQLSNASVSDAFFTGDP